MDTRTADLIDVIDALSVRLLLELTTGARTEGQLVSQLKDVPQPTVNRCLHRLRRAGLVTQEPGRAHAPRRHWVTHHSAETGDFLSSLLALADAINTRDAAARAKAKKRLAAVRASRLGLEVLSSDRRRRRP